MATPAARGIICVRRLLCASPFALDGCAGKVFPIPGPNSARTTNTERRLMAKSSAQRCRPSTVAATILADQYPVVPRGKITTNVIHI
jgi:hypothetical protein